MVFFRGDFQSKPTEQLKNCRDYLFDDYFHFKQENMENNAREPLMKYLSDEWQD